MTDSLQHGFTALEGTANTDDHRSLIEKLIPIARSLANRRGEDGVTVADVREEAVRQGILQATSRGKELAFLGALMKRAGLVETKATRRSHIEGSHGNRHTVWVLP